MKSMAPPACPEPEVAAQSEMTLSVIVAEAWVSRKRAAPKASPEAAVAEAALRLTAERRNEALGATSSMAPKMCCVPFDVVATSATEQLLSSTALRWPMCAAAAQGWCQLPAGIQRQCTLGRRIQRQRASRHVQPDNGHGAHVGEHVKDATRKLPVQNGHAAMPVVPTLDPSAASGLAGGQPADNEWSTQSSRD
jgi:hypothetical protein